MNTNRHDIEPPDDQLGEPITELEFIREQPHGDFVGRVVRSVERRRLGSDLLGFGVLGIGDLLREWLSIIGGLFDRPKRNRMKP